MLNIEECREYLEDETLSDEEVLEIRNNLYSLAEIAIESYVKNKDEYLSN